VSEPTSPAPEAPTRAPRPVARRLAVAAVLAIVVAGIDQLSKAIALAELSTTERIPLLGDLLGLQLAFNAGTVMSLGSGSTWVFTIVSSAAAVAIPIAIVRMRSRLARAGLAVVWGGAVGNLIDRLFAPPGFGVGRVTDMLAYGDLFIGNLADVALGVGAVLLVVGLIRRRDA
jgi:signal peptidase II